MLRVSPRSFHSSSFSACFAPTPLPCAHKAHSRESLRRAASSCAAASLAAMVRIFGGALGCVMPPAAALAAARTIGASLRRRLRYGGQASIALLQREILRIPRFVSLTWRRERVAPDSSATSLFRPPMDELLAAAAAVEALPQHGAPALDPDERRRRARARP